MGDTEPVREMTRLMMDAGQRYLNRVAFGGYHVLPAQFRWTEFWSEIMAAGEPDPDRLLKDALFANIKAGRESAGYSGVRVEEGRIASIYFSKHEAGTSLSAALAKPTPEPSGVVSPEDLQLLAQLQRDNTHDGARPVIGGNNKAWEQARRLSDAGLVAIEQVAQGGRLHITRKGVSALRAALAEGPVDA